MDRWIYFVKLLRNEGLERLMACYYEKIGKGAVSGAETVAEFWTSDANLISPACFAKLLRIFREDAILHV